MTTPSDTDSTAVAPPSGAGHAVDPWVGWRFWGVVGVWGAVVVGALLSFQTAGMTLGIGIGRALGASTSPGAWTEVWWWWVGIVIGVGLAAIGAIVMRRWVALVLALLVLMVAGFFAGNLADEVRPVVAPVEHVDPGPPPCACYSGSFCDCPGG